MTLSLLLAILAILWVSSLGVTTAWPAQGTVFAIDESGTNSNGTYTIINNITSIQGIGSGEVGERDTTVLASSAHTNAPTIPDNNECSFHLLFDPTDVVHKFVRNLKDSPLLFCNFKATMNTGNTNSTAVFSAWVKEFDGYNVEDVDSNIEADVTLRKTGAITWNAAS